MSLLADSVTNSGENGLAFAILVCVLVIYWLPTIVAIFRTKQNMMAISIANSLFGWTFIGWGICLIWALTDDPHHYVPRRRRRRR